MTAAACNCKLQLVITVLCPDTLAPLTVHLLAIWPGTHHTEQLGNSLNTQPWPGRKKGGGGGKRGGGMQSWWQHLGNLLEQDQLASVSPHEQDCAAQGAGAAFEEHEGAGSSAAVPERASC